MSEGTFDYDLICIDTGPAGQRAAVRAAKLGKRVAVVERHRIAGGVGLETGTIPSKTFREAVLNAVRPCGTALDGSFDEGFTIWKSEAAEDGEFPY